MSKLPDPDFWRDRRVLLTGHTGFKGSWTALWLQRLGADVTGLALAPDTDPSLFGLARVAEGMRSHVADIRDREAVTRIVGKAAPDIVLHLAAQPLVRRSLREPVETVATNVLGTAHLLDALRGRAGLSAVLVVTSDKVYLNTNSGDPFGETDPLGGKDPYSASKAAAEIVTGSFAKSFFDAKGVPVATARAGNVVGGGDFSEDRIVPDLVTALRRGEQLVLRHPEAVRPWQHVLDCIAGYLLYAEALATGADVPAALNFGPEPSQPVKVAEFATALQEAMEATSGWRHEPVPGSVEAQLLTLDSSAARRLLDWRDRLPGRASVDAVAAWYRAWLHGADMAAFTMEQIASYGKG
ncbi:CDP-glucose 4,6-dehydratase [Microbaculum marinum]|uniref:CDP-glucose 4,6-dehydratase n=1 Tax=Microbaculum marinum TaxID=1764581 RepID=A0AAW9RH43_9HYPH